GGSISFNSTDKRTTSPGTRADDGGTITTLRVDATQQNPAWKAYVGNISGTLVLDDSNNRSIYEWSLASLTGEILAVRSSVSWSTLSCATNATIASEQTTLTMTSGDIDSINHTFNHSTHKQFVVAGNTLTASTCRVAYPYVNDSAQSPSVSAQFQEILMNDSSSNLIYAASLETNVAGYHNESLYDFQMIVPDNDQAGQITTYYFYVELDS
ncbi:MAG: hypothetical protein KKF89_03085, partial [Nanoarchaeota archaeon]|nr:hypothetical protein [Nanoarchaeota archaeon]